jgi:hypothetical protein
VEARWCWCGLATVELVWQMKMARGSSAHGWTALPDCLAGELNTTKLSSILAAFFMLQSGRSNLARRGHNGMRSVRTCFAASRFRELQTCGLRHAARLATCRLRCDLALC